MVNIIPGGFPVATETVSSANTTASPLRRVTSSIMTEEVSHIHLEMPIDMAV
jgi:hypothetical protein